MTPQSSFMVVAPLERSRADEMRALLATMNSAPGVVDPENALVPFGKFDELHFARFVVLDDPTDGDIEKLYGIKRPPLPVYLTFLGDIDGDYDAFVNRLVEIAGPGLKQIFSLCDGFSTSTDLKAWIVAHETRPAANYCNWVGRTVRQTKEEAQLRTALREFLDRSPDLLDKPAGVVHQKLRQFVETERIPLTPSAATPAAWAIRHCFDWLVLILLIAGGVVTLPVTIVPLLLIAWRLRVLEKSDPEYTPRPDRQWESNLAAIEDHGVTNQFSVIGALKPGLLRAFLTRIVLFVIDLTARTIYTKGRLARVHTIHFARWVYLDNQQRMMFASNYDGSLEAYMDDFINKVGFGLNVVFSNGAGYPRTDWLVLKGCKDEQAFKHILRRHQLPTEVWYNAHFGLTAHDLARNAKIREGLEKSSLSETEARDWVTLI